MLLVKRPVTQTYDLTDLQHTYAKSWCLADVPGYAQFEGLFDQWKLCMVKMRFRSSYNMGNQSATGITGAACQHFHWAIDYTDEAAPANYEELEKYQTHQMRMITGDKPFDITVRPKLQAMAYEGIGTGYLPTSPRWIGCDDPNVKHYGIKFAILPTVPGTLGVSVGRLVIYTTYYLAFKQTK